jgi:tRNA (cmo5U34)-methyltransferase
MADQKEKTDNVVPGDKWLFDADVAKSFNNMLERSIPGYWDMRKLCYELGRQFVYPGSTVLDMGASRGEALRPFIEEGIARKFIGLEVSEPMRDEMVGEYANNAQVEVRDYDLRFFDSGDFKGEDISLCLSVLTLLFTPIQYRSQIVRTAYELLPEGGAFIVVEKVLGQCSDIDDLLVDSYYAMKKDNGYTQEDIDKKKASLEGVQVIQTTETNLRMLFNEGFRKVDSFYQNLNFCGWIAIK